MTDPSLNEVFDRLDDWRRLPDYQLERRADIFFALALPDVLAFHYREEFKRELIPEFPLRLGTLWTDIDPRRQNLSVKVDYVAFTQDIKKVFFVELKTDLGSRNDRQDTNLERAKDLEFRILIEGIHRIRSRTQKPRKYDHLIDLVSRLGVGNLVDKPKIVYIQPTSDQANHKDFADYIYFEEFADVVKDRGSIGKRFEESLREWINPA